MGVFIVIAAIVSLILGGAVFSYYRLVSWKHMGEKLGGRTYALDHEEDGGVDMLALLTRFDREMLGSVQGRILSDERVSYRGEEFCVSRPGHAVADPNVIIGQDSKGCLIMRGETVVHRTMDYCGRSTFVTYRVITKYHVSWCR